MAVTFNSVISFNSTFSTSKLSTLKLQASNYCTRTTYARLAPPSTNFLPLEESSNGRKHHRRVILSVANSDKAFVDIKGKEATSGELEFDPTSDAPNGDNMSEETEAKKAPLTVREKLRAARVLSRYGAPKPRASSAKLGSSVLDALKESDKGRRSGLPEAPTNMLDDSKRGMPKAGLTFDLPGGRDLFIIVFSFVFISTAMFATTYLVWKLGAIHFNEN